jgi:O-succinylbenzoate synthase
MRLERVELFRISMPLVGTFRTSFGEVSQRQCLLIAVSSQGLTGWGECVADAWPGYSYETAGTAWEILEQHFVPALLGQEFDGVGGLHQRLARFRGHPMARAGLEMALWDWLGRSRGQSLQALLGGRGERVEVGVSVGIEPTPEALVERVGGYVDQGYRRVKLKIEPGLDVEPVRAVRGAFPDLRLQVDANAAYTLATAGPLEELDAFDLLLIEQPLAEEDLLDHSRLQSRLSTPICLDESIGSAAAARQALALDACRVINIKAGRVGGLAEAVAIHDLCRSQDVPVWCGGMLETGLGRAANLALASLPGFTLPGDISASDRYYAEDIASPRFDLADGCLTVPQSPGLGVEVDLQAVQRFSLRAQSFAA